MMIATLNGTVSEKLSEQVIVEVGGVGYGLFMPALDANAVTVGSNLKVYVYENIKEDTHDLYGFREVSTKHLFEKLLSVKNVGPKVALAVLDIGSSDMVRGAIASGDVKLLQTARGVGKRAAEQIVVELRDKVGVPVGEGAEGIVSRGGINQADEAMQALLALGFTDADAQVALQPIDGSLPTEERVRLALKGGF